MAVWLLVVYIWCIYMLFIDGYKSSKLQVRVQIMEDLKAALPTLVPIVISNDSQHFFHKIQVRIQHVACHVFIHCVSLLYLLIIVFRQSLI